MRPLLWLHPGGWLWAGGERPWKQPDCLWPIAEGWRQHRQMFCLWRGVQTHFPASLTSLCWSLHDHRHPCIHLLTYAPSIPQNPWLNYTFISMELRNSRADILAWGVTSDLTQLCKISLFFALGWIKKYKVVMQYNEIISVCTLEKGKKGGWITMMACIWLLYEQMRMQISHQLLRKI